MLKKYSIPVFRELGCSELKKENIEDSFFYLENSVTQDVEVNETFMSKIYTIDYKKDEIIIYSNTLNISITDIQKDGVPLYYHKFFKEEEEADTFIKSIKGSFIKTYNDVDFVVFYNTTTVSELSEIIYEINNPIYRHPNVKVRKLKNRFKITIKNINTTTFNVKLNSPFLFQPILHDNFVEITESILKINNKEFYIYNHSFNEILKKEIKTKKDPVYRIEEEDGEYVVYQSWRSNLLYDTRLNNTLYFYLKLDGSKTDMIEQSFQEIYNNNYILLFKIDKKHKINKIVENPYLDTFIKEPSGIDFTLITEQAIDYKYSHYNNIRFNNTKLILDLKNLYQNKLKLVEQNGNTIYQEDMINFPSNTFTQKSKSDLPSFLIDNLENLKTILGE